MKMPGEPRPGASAGAKLRFFTPEEVDALLPALENIFQEIFIYKRKAELRFNRWQSRREKEGSSVQDAVEDVVDKSTIDFLVKRVSERIDRINGLGGIVKDLDKGLVDFPCVGRFRPAKGRGAPEGRNEVVYLCWKFGEKRLRHWHGLNEGYASRKPIESLGERGE